MSEPKQSAPIQVAQGNVAYELVFVDDQEDSDSVLMRVTIDPSGDVLEERVPRASADNKLTSSVLVDDVIDSKLVDLLANYSGPAS